jgi:hypothetical protein
VTDLKLYELVRVARLLHPPEHYGSLEFDKRLPAVGDADLADPSF